MKVCQVDAAREAGGAGAAAQVRWPKTLVVVSHAREFLNAVTTDTIHLHSKKLTMYKGAAAAACAASPGPCTS